MIRSRECLLVVYYGAIPHCDHFHPMAEVAIQQLIGTSTFVAEPVRRVWTLVNSPYARAVWCGSVDAGARAGRNGWGSTVVSGARFGRSATTLEKMGSTPVARMTFKEQGQMEYA